MVSFVYKSTAAKVNIIRVLVVFVKTRIISLLEVCVCIFIISSAREKFVFGFLFLFFFCIEVFFPSWFDTPLPAGKGSIP